MTAKQKYILNDSSGSFLPADLNTSNLINITTMNDAFAVYIDTETGQKHDGSVYYQQYLEESKDQD